MNAQPDTLKTLAHLAAEIQHGQPGPDPVPGRLGHATAPLVLNTPSDVRGRLAGWLAPGEIAGWILTTEKLTVFDGGTGSIPDDPVLAAELHRSSDGHSLNLRHTPKGWIWEELQLLPENSEVPSFIEESSCFVNSPSDHPASGESLPERKACYQVEWRLDSSNAPAIPATFRPARSRFVGWSDARV